jgi:hypothetical protein
MYITTTVVVQKETTLKRRIFNQELVENLFVSIVVTFSFLAALTKRLFSFLQTNFLINSTPLAPMEVEILLCRCSAQKIVANSGNSS